MALHYPGKTFTLCGADDVDHLPGLENSCGELLPEGVLGSIGGTYFNNVAAWGDPGFCEMTCIWLVDLSRVNRTKCDLYRGLAVYFWGAHLRDDTRPGLHNCNGNNLVVLVPYLSHAQLFAEQSLDVVTHGVQISSKT